MRGDLSPGLLIHVGTQKTGTTTLQGFLSANVDALRAKGLHFVETGRKHISHNSLSRPLRGAAAAEIWHSVAAEVTAAPEACHLMSSELFFEPEVAASLAAHLPAEVRAGTRIVVYLRRQDTYLEAMYKQYTKNGRIHEAPERFVERIGHRLADYQRLLATFAEALAPERILVRRFERDRMKDGDITADFFDALGIDSAAGFTRPAHPANETLSRAAAEHLGALARHTCMNTREIGRELLRGDPAPPRRSGDVFPLKVRRAIMAHHAPGNAAIAVAYLGDADLFDLSDLEDGRPDPYPDPDEALVLHEIAREKVIAAIGRIDARARSKLFRGRSEVT